VEPIIHIEGCVSPSGIQDRVAVGYHKGKRIEIKGQTQLDALTQWRKKAALRK